MRKVVVLLVSVVGLQSLASPAMASPRAIRATGSSTVAIQFETIEIVPQGQQCLIYAEQVITYTGTLEGTSETVGPARLRFFASCEEVRAGDAGIPRSFSSVEHFVGTDGKEATFHSVGRADAAGDYKGIMALHGDLIGVVRVSASAASGALATYDGIVVVRD